MIAEQPPRSARATAKPTILIVDDAPENLTLLASLLKPNYRVRVATNGQKALEIARSDPPPDLILLDIMMPEIDGYQVCQCLKSSPTTANIPIIFVTGLEEKPQLFQADGGAEDYITKPIQPGVLQAKVAAHLKLHLGSDQSVS